MLTAKPEPNLVVACDLTVFTPEQRDHHVAVSHELFTAAREVRELNDGYTFRLPGDSPMLFTLADFIRDERLCCPFWTFGIEVEAQGGAIWLHLTGPEGAKELVASELGNFLDAAVALAAGLR